MIRILLVGLALLVTLGSDAWAGIVEIDLAASGAILSGYWAQSTTAGRIIVGGGNGSQLDATVTGTSVELTCYSTDTASIKLTVDGVSSTPVFSTINAWTTLKVALGADATHSLTIKQPYSRASFFLDTGTGTVRGATFSVTGQAPFFGPPSAQFGLQYQLGDSVNVTPYIQAEGGLAPMDADGYPSVYHSSPVFADEALYFTASVSGPISGWIYGGGGALGLYVDGAKAGTIALPQTNTYQWISLFTGDGLPHRYGLSQAYDGSEGLSIWSLMMVGGTLSTVITPARPRLIAYGDSITQAQVGANDDSSLAYAQCLGVNLGWAVYNRGIAGTSVHSFASGSPLFTTEAGESRTSDVTSVASGADGVVILYGTNDMAQMGGVESIADFQASYQHMLASIIAGLPPACRILCVGILPRTDFTPSAIDSWNAAVQAAVSAEAASNVIYVSPADWGLMQNGGSAVNYTDANKNTLDGLHPNGNGYSLIVNNLLPYLIPQVPTVTATVGGSVAEPGGVNGKVIVSRTRETSRTLTVNYALKGSAQAGVDYKALSGIVTIPEGATQAIIKIKAINSTSYRGVHVAKIKLLPATDSSYSLGNATVAKIQVLTQE